MIEVDARNLLCPMPVIRLQNAVERVEDGEEVVAICTDPGAELDVPAWCRVHGHELLGVESNDDEIRIRVRVCK